MRKRKPLTPVDQACLESARRMVCGDKGDVYVFEDGIILIGRSGYKLDPSHDPTDALILVVAEAMKLHLTDVDFGKLRDKFVATDVGDVFANDIYDQLSNFSDDEWAHIRERVEWYVNDNARQAAYDTDKSGES